MAIRFSKYVNITSGVIGQSSVDDRDFMMRVFIDDPRVPQGTVAEFDTLADVGTYFGTSSSFYAIASEYFSFISKQIQSPNAIQFARWVSVAQAAQIYGNTAAKALATFTAITAGGFTLSIGGVPYAMTAINLSGAADLNGVAALIQTKIRTGSGTQFTNATVAYDATTNRFNFVSGTTGAAALSVTDGAQGVATALGWVSGTGLIVSPGAAVENPDAAFNNSVTANDNFGSFVFHLALTQNQALAVAQANYALNNAYLDLLWVSPANASAWAAAIGGVGGVAATLSPLPAEYPAILPGMIFAATDYTRANAAQNYMYQVAGGLTPSVTDDASADLYDGLQINYYGQTLKNGRAVNFYQDGVLWGGVNDARDIGVYCNEIWFKSAMGTMLINLLLALTRIPADSTGRRILLANSAAIINQAKFNGTVDVGKTLTAQQQAAVYQATNDPLAYIQVQTIGYWLDWVISSYVTNGITKYQAEYTLVYGKADSIRRVTGIHDLV
jgi:hypothetical protein